MGVCLKVGESVLSKQNVVNYTGSITLHKMSWYKVSAFLAHIDLSYLVGQVNH